MVEELDPFCEEQIELKSTLDFFPPSFDEVPSIEVKSSQFSGSGQWVRTKRGKINFGPIQMFFFLLGRQMSELF